MVEKGRVAKLKFKGSVKVENGGVQGGEVFAEAVGINVGRIVRIFIAVNDNRSWRLTRWTTDLVWSV